MVLNIKYFGKLAEISGVDTEVINTDEMSLEMLLTNLNNSTPGFENEVYAIFVNNKKVDNTDISLKADDEICLMPPFAGG